LAPAGGQNRSAGPSCTNLVTSGYAGQVYAVNPHASELEGVPCLPSPAALPGPVDVAVVAVPRPAGLDVAEECGKRGVKTLVVITSELDQADKTSLLTCCRRHGMRLIGPNCFGIAVPGIGLDATFGAQHPAAGKAGLAVQSGGLGIALCGQLSRLGIGISSFASLGDKCDVSGNDLLMWWEQDPATKLAVLYLESLGNPRKFGRIARHAGATMPVLTVHAGRSAAGQRAAVSHTAAAATPLVTREALVRTSWGRRHPRHRRAARCGRAAGQPAQTPGRPGRHRFQRRRSRGAGRRRLHRRGPARRHARRPDPR
jgi:acyl-CoA synthetase (NDP forming)